MRQNPSFWTRTAASSTSVFNTAPISARSLDISETGFSSIGLVRSSNQRSLGIASAPALRVHHQRKVALTPGTCPDTLQLMFKATDAGHFYRVSDPGQQLADWGLQ